MNELLTGKNRISRFHDEKGNFVDTAGIPNALPAFLSAVAKHILDHRPQVPMISYRARRMIASLLSEDTRMVEFGSGNSTPWFAARVGFVLSIEDLPEWFDYVQKRLKEKEIQNVRHELRTTKNYADLSDIDDSSLDFTLIDGTNREGCVRSVIPKLKPGGWLYLDNSDKDQTFPDGDMRRAENALREVAAARSGSIYYFSDFSPTNFFVEQGMLVQI